MPNPDPTRRGAARRIFPGLLAVAISVGLLLWALRGVRLADVLQHVAAAKPAPLLAAVVLGTLTFPLRLIRWRLLLRDDRGQPYPAGPLWHAVALGFMANNVLPLRAGELVRAYSASRLAGIRFATVLSSIAVERIFDGLTVVALLTLALLTPDLPDSISIGGVSVAHVAQTGGVVGGAALLVAILVLAAPLAAERLVRRVLPWKRLADRIVGLIEEIRQGLVVLRAPARLLAVVFWSLVLWLGNALAFYVGFWSFDIPVSYAGALLLQGLLVLGISIPSTPGFFGPFEAVIVAVLGLYGVPRDLAFSYAISYHLTSFTPITLLGLWSLARTPEGLRGWREVRG
ncbi:MAG TPA: lysylphosphatidylglycerol synthase transmembrane domain-containing protein [Gemmatimonadales bacterium]|nr:lysylphosphatidylglycerol synthase transmembrane domain-containing protein [Gemmatimonadales bacterium]